MEIIKLITGVILIILGFAFLTSNFMGNMNLVYGIILLVLGFFILLNKKEDQIEQRKDLITKKEKK